MDRRSPTEKSRTEKTKDRRRSLDFETAFKTGKQIDDERKKKKEEEDRRLRERAESQSISDAEIERL